MIFDEATRRKLQKLTLEPRRIKAGAFAGKRRSKKHGVSDEFADYRDYVPGDDLRRLDWNVYARLERPMVKLLEDERDLAVYLLVDASRSMDWGSEERNKLQYALRLAAALGLIALSAGDQLTVVVFQASEIGSQYGPARGSHHHLPLLHFLESQQAGGTVTLLEASRRFTRLHRRPGLAVLISDLYSQDGGEPLLQELQRPGHEVCVVHLLSPEEIEPELSGDLRLLDVESRAYQDVSLNRQLLSLYRDRLQAWRSELQRNCRSRGMPYLPLNTSLPWETATLIHMRRAGILR